jgi:hypothetical protein
MKKQVRFWWDSQESNNTGWYAIVEHIDENDVTVYTDSVKTDFPINLSQYKQDEPEGVEFVLQDFFPDYDIVKVQ